MAVTPRAPAHWKPVYLPDFPAFLVACKKSATIRFFRLNDGGFDSIPLFKCWNRYFMDKLFMLWKFCGNLVVEHDSAIYRFVNMNPVFFRNDDCG